MQVFEALRRDRRLIWSTQQLPTTADDVIAFSIRAH